jgi:hypothetical protein
MSWLNANEYFFMEMIARDRVETLRSTIDSALSRAETGDEPPRDPPMPGQARLERSASTCGWRQPHPVRGRA